MDKVAAHKHSQFRGALSAAVAAGHTLLFTTLHVEGQPTPLYGLDLDAGTLTSRPMPTGAIAAVADESTVFIAGNDGQLYRAGLASGAVEPFATKLAKAAPALALVGADRIAVGAGTSVKVLGRDKGKELQSFELEETITALAASADGAWIVAGTEKGTIVVLDGEEKADFAIGDKKKVHESAVSCLLFDPDEPRVYSAGADQRLFLTHVRGELEAEDRGGGAAHEGPIRAITLGPEDKLFTAGQDATLKTWTRGAHRRRPSSLKDVGRAVAIVLAEHKGRPHLVLLCDDATIRLHPMDAAGKVEERSLTFHDAYAHARNELDQKEVARRDAALQALAAYNDQAAIDLLTERAGSDPDHGLKVKATNLLSGTGNLRAVKSLERLIQAQEEQVRRAALAGLRTLEGPATLRPLELALKAGQRDIGVEAVQGLEKLAPSDDQAMAMLVATLDSDPVEVRVAVLTSLEALHAANDPEASRIALRSKRADIRRLALIRLYQRKLLEHPSVQVTLRRHQDDKDAGVRQTAFLVSLLASDDLATALRARDRDLHRLLWELETHGQKLEADASPPKTRKAKAELDDGALRSLFEAMACRSLDTCLAGARGLASLQDARAFGTLLQLTNDKTPAARVETCKAMAELGDPRGIPRLRQMLRDEAHEVRDAAFSALVRLEDATPLRAAEAGLTAPFDDVRGRGLQLLVRQLKKAAKGKEADADLENALKLMGRALNDPSKAVRGEAFKAVLSQQVGGGDAETLRFALTSIHADVRRDVLGEVMGRIQESWAPAMLLALFADPEASVRQEAFAFAQKRSKGKAREPLEAALSGPHEDLKLQAVEALTSRHVAGLRELLAAALDDDHRKVRIAAIDGLVVDEAQEALEGALASKHEDVRIRASVACAAFGSDKAFEPLMGFLREEEPELAEKKGIWREQVVLALGGLAELGDPLAAEVAAPLIDNDDPQIRRAATTALGWVCGERGPRDALVRAMSHADVAVKNEAAMGLAVLGDPAGLPMLEAMSKEGGEAAMRGLLGALALGPDADDLFMSFLDHADATVRSRALLLMMLVESSEQDGVPDRCLAALSSSHPRIRLSAARALESFDDAGKFAAWVTELFNDRGDDLAPWTFSHENVRAIAEMVTHGDPATRIRAARVLDALVDEKPARLERAWRTFSRRNDKAIAALVKTASKRKPVTVKYAPAEMRRIVIGAYAGLSRQEGTALDARVRQTAMLRLTEMALADAGLLPTVRPLLAMALADRDVAVRKVAFECLERLGVGASELAAEAISVGLRDMGVAGLRLLSANAGASGGDGVLESVYLENTDGLEVEAGKLLAETKGWPTVHGLGLTAKASGVRDEAVRGLARAYDGDDGAKKALRGALASAHEHVRDAAALALGHRKDASAFDALVALLRTRRQADAIAALERLGDPRTPDMLLDRIVDDPTGTGDVNRLMAAAGSFRNPDTAERLFELVEQPRFRKPCFDALLVISGYDQRIEDGDDRDPSTLSLARFERPTASADWETKQFPRHDGILAKMLETGIRLGDNALILRLLPGAQWSRGKEVDEVVASLCASSADAVRDRAIPALGFRLRKRGAPATALVAALTHANPKTQFLAAEALAWSGRSEGIRVLMTGVDMMPELVDRRRAVRALGELADAAALDVLLRLATEEGHALQEDAAEAIGHLASTDKAETIEKILLRTARGDTGVAMRAMVGLRWFNSREGWTLLRERSRDPLGIARYQAVELLAYDRDDATRDALVQRLEDEVDYNIARRAAESLRAIDGPESLEPDYVLLRTRFVGLESDTLERLQEQGDAARIMEALPRIPAQCGSAVFEPLVSKLLAREPLPIDAAASQLGSPHEQVGAVAASILGRAGPIAAKKHGKALSTSAAEAASAWEKKRALVASGQEPESGLASFTERYVRMIWACGRLGAADDVVLNAAKLTGEAAWTRAVRTEALHALAHGKVEGAVLEVLRAALSDNDARIRALAASAIARGAPGKVGSVVAGVVDDRSSLDRLLAGAPGGDGLDEALRTASASAHTQGLSLPHMVARADVRGLISALENRDLPEVTRLGALEGLARIANQEAQAALEVCAKRAEEDEEIRKAAWRGLRRARRYASRTPREVRS